MNPSVNTHWSGIRLSIFPLLFSLALQTANAQWIQTSGPEGGLGTHVVVHGSKVFAAASVSGLYMSANDGASWSYVGFSNMYISGLVSDGNSLFVGGQGMYRSSDDGVTWVPINTGLSGPGLVITSLYNQGNTLLAGTVSGIYNSTNRGNTWTFKGLANKQIETIAGNDDKLFAGGTITDGLFVSSDHGDHWAPTSITGGVSVYSVTSYGSTIFVATLEHFYRSLDNGDHWTVEGAGLSNAVKDLVMDGTLLFAGTYGSGIMVSADNGKTFVNANFKFGQIQSLTRKNDILFATSVKDGILISQDHGKNWRASVGGMKAQQITSLIKKGNTFITGSYGGGISISEDKGDHWTQVISEMLDQPGSMLIPFALCSSGNNIIAGTLSQGVITSSDNGVTWQSTNLNFTVNSLVVKDPYVFAGTDMGVYISANQGVTWSSVGLTDQRVMTLLVSKDKIYAGTEKPGVSVSQNNGVSWSAMNSGMTDVNVRVMGSNGNTLYAATVFGGMYRSTDEDIHWTRVSGPTAGRLVLAISRFNDVLFVSTDLGVYISTDDGGSWKLWSGTVSYPNVVSFIFDDANTIYAGSYNSVIKKQLFTVENLSTGSANIGSTIKIAGEFFSATPTDNVVKFNGARATVVSASFSELSVIVPPDATTGPVFVTVGNITSRSANDFTVSVVTGDIRDNLDVQENVLYPNPAHDVIMIDNLTFDPPFTIQISDAMGKQVDAQYITHKLLSPLDVSHLAAGMYILKMLKGEKTYAIKFVKK